MHPCPTESGRVQLLRVTEVYSTCCRSRRGCSSGRPNRWSAPRPPAPAAALPPFPPPAASARSQNRPPTESPPAQRSTARVSCLLKVPPLAIIEVYGALHVCVHLRRATAQDWHSGSRDHTAVLIDPYHVARFAFLHMCNPALCRNCQRSKQCSGDKQSGWPLMAAPKCICPGRKNHDKQARLFPCERRLSSLALLLISVTRPPLPQCMQISFEKCHLVAQSNQACVRAPLV